MVLGKSDWCTDLTVVKATPEKHYREAEHLLQDHTQAFPLTATVLLCITGRPSNTVYIERAPTSEMRIRKLEQYANVIETPLLEN